MLLQGPGPGPVIVKCRIVTLCAPFTRTIAFGPVMTSGALMMACRSGAENSVKLSLPVGIVTCSIYVPAQTLIVSPGIAAFTAAWIVVYWKFGQSSPVLLTISMPLSLVEDS